MAKRQPYRDHIWSEEEAIAQIWQFLAHQQVSQPSARGLHPSLDPDVKAAVDREASEMPLNGLQASVCSLYDQVKVLKEVIKVHERMITKLLDLFEEEEDGTT